LQIYIFQISMAEMKTSTVESLLGALSICPMSGYEMRRFMEQSTGNFWGESFGQIYPALRSMLGRGLIAAVKEGKDARPGKKVYRITEAGLEHLRDWLDVPARPQVWRNELLLKVFYGNQAERGTIAAHVEEWRQRYAADVERYEAILRKLQAEQAGHPGMPYWCMTVRYGIAESKALMGWCKETLAELEKQGLGIRD
jgi:DNA-binding PadR family transcriptional regulator